MFVSAGAASSVLVGSVDKEVVAVMGVEPCQPSGVASPLP